MCAQRRRFGALSNFIGERYPDFDAEEHPQQFTEDSLDRVMVRGGFVLERRLFALGYSSFGYLQGSQLRGLPAQLPLSAAEEGQSGRGLPRGGVARDLWHGGLAAALAPAALALSLHDRVRTAKGAVLTACYRSAP